MKASEFRPASARGFTLIELVLSVALMSVILLAAYVCLSAATSSRRMVEARGDALQNARVAMALLTADLRAACPLSKEFEFLGMDRMIEDVEADNLDFATHHCTPRHAGEGDFCEVSYFVEKDPATGEFSLWRRVDTFPDSEPLAGGRREVIIRGIRGFSLEYYDGLEWFDEWGDPEGRRRGADEDSLLLPNNLSGMPDAVQITLYLTDDSTLSQTTSTSAPDQQSPGNASTSTSVQQGAPLVFQTVARLNLAPISAERSYASPSGTADRDDSSGGSSRGGGN